MLEIFEKYELVIFDWEGTLASFAHPIDELFPETLNLLSELKEKKLAIATGKSKDSLMLCLETHGISDRFDVICSSTDFPSKPCPDMLTYVLTTLSINSDDAIMVGDSLVDILAAQAAKIDSLLINRSSEPCSYKPTYEVSSFF